VIHALSCFSCVVFSTPLFGKEFYVIYRHNISLAAAVEIYVLVNTINFIIAFKYKIRLNFSWNMETGNYLQTYCNLYVYYDRGIVFNFALVFLERWVKTGMGLNCFLSWTPNEWTKTHKYMLFNYNVEYEE
jgi:hypothetical protein